MAIAVMEDLALRHVSKLQQLFETKSHEHFMKIPSMGVPSGKHTKSYWKWGFIVDLPIENSGFSIVMLVYQRVFCNKPTIRELFIFIRIFTPPIKMVNFGDGLLWSTHMKSPVEHETLLVRASAKGTAVLIGRIKSFDRDNYGLIESELVSSACFGFHIPTGKLTVGPWKSPIFNGN